MAKSGERRKRPYGLAPRSFSPTVRDQVDQDYVDKLSDEEREWLAKFNQAFYDGSFRAFPPAEESISSDTLEEGTWSPEERRVAYRANNARKRDAFGRARGVGSLTYAGGADAEAFADEAQALDATPTYLDSAEWKAAVAAWRKHIDEKTTHTPAGRLARWRYEEIKKVRHEEEG